MKQSKRQARDRNRKAKKQSPGAVPPTAAAYCPSCGTPAQPDARFCYKCGTNLGQFSAPRQWHAPTVILYAVIALGVVVVAAGAIFMSGGNTGLAPPPPSVSRNTPQGAGQQVDIASMSPREAADRLFNRVIMASEQDNMDEALQFAPMAIQAYERVARLDADAHYHMGLVYAVMGDFDSVRNQVATIKQYTPNHLLGLILEHDAAEQEGNPFGAARAAAAFTEAYDAEIRAGRPEYEAHRNTIEAFRTENTGQ
ncbi:MAG: zinc ribbon domain-containing protein [Alphaproteobacteria bacterium]|nr:zinc ribbon domain-containing protein [Alphaproteobacteria bacterium]